MTDDSKLIFINVVVRYYQELVLYELGDCIYIRLLNIVTLILHLQTHEVNAVFLFT